MIFAIVLYIFNFLVNFVTNTEQNTRKDTQESSITKNMKEDELTSDEITHASRSNYNTKKNFNAVGNSTKTSYKPFNKRKDTNNSEEKQNQFICTFEILLNKFDNFYGKKVLIPSWKKSFNNGFKVKKIKSERIPIDYLIGNYKHMDCSDIFIDFDIWHKIYITLCIDKNVLEKEFNISFRDDYGETVYIPFRYIKDKKQLEFLKYGLNYKNTIYSYYLRLKSNDKLQIPVIQSKQHLARNLYYRSCLFKRNDSNSYKTKQTTSIISDDTNKVEYDGYEDIIEDKEMESLRIKTLEDQNHYSEFLKLHRKDQRSQLLECLRRHTNTSTEDLKSYHIDSLETNIHNDLFFGEDYQESCIKYNDEFYYSDLLHDNNFETKNTFDNSFEENTTYEELNITQERQNLFQDYEEEINLNRESTSDLDLLDGQLN